MDRRDALRALGAAVGAPRFLSMDAEAMLDGMRPHLDGEHDHGKPQALRRSTYTFQTLDPHQRATVAELTEMIIPATDTPGAKAAKVDEYVDIILSEWSTEADKGALLKGLADFDARSVAMNGKTFVESSEQQRTALLAVLDAELTAARNARKAWRRGEGAPPPDYRALFFHQMRSLTVSGYYSSEVGYKQERRQQLVPGIYKACGLMEGM
jgi:hypothetical protein